MGHGVSPTLHLYLEGSHLLPHIFLLLKFDPFFQVTVKSGLPSFELPGTGGVGAKNAQEGVPKNSAFKKSMALKHVKYHV